jgi:hypothetical protein
MPIKEHNMSNVDRVRSLLEEAIAILDGTEDQPRPATPSRSNTEPDQKSEDITLIGKVGRPTFTTTPTGLSLWKAGIGATNQQGSLTWINVVAWRDLADQANEYRRGDEISVRGKFSTNTYTDRNGVEQSNEVFTISSIE